VSQGESKFEPLIKRFLLGQIAKGIFVTLGFVFVIGTIFLAWAFKTGRAVESVRQEILTTLKDECDLDASFTSLSLDPIAFEISLTDLALARLDGEPLLSVKAALVSVRLLPLFYGRLQLDRVAVLEPRAALSIKEGKLEKLPRCIPTEGPSGDSPLVFGIRELTIERGRMTMAIEDRAALDIGEVGINLAESKSGGMDLSRGLASKATWKGCCRDRGRSSSNVWRRRSIGWSSRARARSISWGRCSTASST
jgi:hypothetical protein